MVEVVTFAIRRCCFSDVDPVLDPLANGSRWQAKQSAADSARVCSIRTSRMASACFGVRVSSNSSTCLRNSSLLGSPLGGNRDLGCDALSVVLKLWRCRFPVGPLVAFLGLDVPDMVRAIVFDDLKRRARTQVFGGTLR